MIKFLLYCSPFCWCVAFVLCGLAGYVIPFASSFRNATVAGIVYSDDGRALSGASVTLESAAGSVVQSAVTDDAGAFRFHDVSPGRYLAGAEKPGFVAMRAGATRFNQPGSSVVVEDRAIEDVRITLPRGAVIAGTVFTHGGEPAALASIGVARLVVDPLDGTRNFSPLTLGRGSSVTQTRTDSRGAFRLYGLPAGRCVLRAWASNEPLSQGVPFFTYYPGTLDSAAAEWITISPGDERQLTLSLQQPVRTRVYGTLLGTGANVHDLRVMIGGGPFPPAGIVQPDGSFAVSNVTPGQRVVQARGREVRDGTSEVLWGQSEAMVTGPDPVQADVVLRPAMRFAGRIAFSGRQPPAASDVSVSLIPMYPWHRDPPLAASARPDGSFVIRNVAPGWYRIEPRVAPGAGAGRAWTPSRVIVRGRDVAGVPIEVMAGDAIADAIVELTNLTQSISGTLRHDGLPGDRTQIVVLVFAGDNRYWTLLSKRLRFEQLARDGSFMFADLPAGEYRLIALVDPDPDDLPDPVFLKSILSASTPVFLAPGEHKTLTLQASR